MKIDRQQLPTMALVPFFKTDSQEWLSHLESEARLGGRLRWLARELKRGCYVPLVRTTWVALGVGTCWEQW